MKAKAVVAIVSAAAVVGVILLIAVSPTGARGTVSAPIEHAAMGRMAGMGGGAAEAAFGAVGTPAPDGTGIDPGVYLTTSNFSNLPADEREHYYRETPIAGGKLLREYWVFIQNREIEIAPGVLFPAWTFNGQVPGPTIRATVGDTIRVHFTNGGDRPHTMHFHGFHPADMDGSAPEDFVPPGGTFTYEFGADPVGLHLYHCHVTPLTQHIHKGLYGVYIVDPAPRREPARELVMMMDGFDTNFDEENEIYAVNGVAFYYNEHPIDVRTGELVRIYLVNILEYDQTNSFHVHANFFDEYRTGTGTTPNSFTDTVILGQAERSILELRFRHPGAIMFHAHKTEFSERGWMGVFNVSPEE
jgi:FtsP/CotA-like multicopper oxidase with cupredoxin domain